MAKTKRKMTRVTGNRKLDRSVAHYNMEMAGYTQINKGKKQGFQSAFAKNWRQYI
jgi:hypothetical protein